MTNSWNLKMVILKNCCVQDGNNNQNYDISMDERTKYLDQANKIFSTKGQKNERIRRVKCC